MPLILPIPASIPLHIPVYGTDLVQMIADMLKIPMDDDIYDKLAINPVLKLGSELAIGRALTPEEYRQLLNTPNSPLQKATAIKYLLFQILFEISKIRIEIALEYTRLAELATRLNYWLDEAEKIRDEKIKQISTENQQEKMAQEKKIMDDYLADIAPIQNYINAVTVAQQNLQIIDNKLHTLSEEKITTLKDRTKQIAVIYQETQATLIAAVQVEIDGYDKVLGTLASRLADAERELNAYSGDVKSLDDPELLRRKEGVAQLNRQITGVSNIRQMNNDYKIDEGVIFDRTSAFCLDSETKLKKVGISAENMPPPIFQAGMNGVLLEFATTIGRKIRSDQTYRQVMEETAKNPNIIDALGKVPAQIAVPKIDRSTLVNLVKKSNDELQKCREQIKSAKDQHEKIHITIVEKTEEFEKKYGLNPLVASADDKSNASPQNVQERLSLDKHDPLAHAKKMLRNRVQAHAELIKNASQSGAETAKSNLSAVNPRAPFRPRSRG